MKPLLAGLLFAFTLPSYGAYELISKADDGDEFYLDLESRVFSSPYVRVDYLINHAEEQDAFGVKHLSQVIETEYNCETRERRWHQVTGYKGAWGIGLITSQYNSRGDWYTVKKGSVGEMLLRAACAGPHGTR